jgi:hypothetical protein
MVTGPVPGARLPIVEIVKEAVVLAVAFVVKDDPVSPAGNMTVLAPAPYGTDRVVDEVTVLIEVPTTDSPTVFPNDTLPVSGPTSPRLVSRDG